MSVGELPSGDKDSVYLTETETVALLLRLFSSELLSINQSIKFYLYEPIFTNHSSSHRALTRCDILCP